jgi:hypothetical protein
MTLAGCCLDYESNDRNAPLAVMMCVLTVALGPPPAFLCSVKANAGRSYRCNICIL